jgi:hypothetical protein
MYAVFSSVWQLAFPEMETCAVVICAFHKTLQHLPISKSLTASNPKLYVWWLMHHGMCLTWSSDRTFKSLRLMRKSDVSAFITAPACRHIPTASQFILGNHQNTGDWNDTCQPIWSQDSKCKCFLVNLWNRLKCACIYISCIVLTCSTSCSMQYMYVYMCVCVCMYVCKWVLSLMSHLAFVTINYGRAPLGAPPHLTLTLICWMYLYRLQIIRGYY